MLSTDIAAARIVPSDVAPRAVVFNRTVGPDGEAA
jgi:hypothetical protein